MNQQKVAVNQQKVGEGLLASDQSQFDYEG